VIDALAAPQSVLLLGGTSEIGLAVLRRLPRGRLRRVVLAGRDHEATAAVGKRLAAEGFGGIELVDLDAADTGPHGRVLDALFDAGDIDVTVLAVGVLGDQQQAEDDPEQAVRTAQVNYVGPVSLALHVGRRLRSQGHGTLVVLSSVAGRQARRSNFVYGSTKAGLDALALGLGDALAGSGAQVVVVRPGFVRTRMTQHLPAAPLATTADAVARRVVDGLRRGRTVVYAPPAMALLSAALVVLPRRVLRRLPF
jgi:decaprenylphospho-beta-D-erythro-pentofuranosid-2-ulose 2-reductase